jgi:aminodeoxyfutalosine synthase
MVSADVLTLGMAADDARRRMLATTVVTYVRVHQVTADELAGAAGLVIPEAASEVRLYRLPDSLDAAVSQLEALQRHAGARRIVAFSMAELAERGWSGPDTLRRLKAAGLGDVAELPVDELDDPVAAIDALRSAGIDPQRLTVARPLGERRIDIIAGVQRAFEAHDCLRRFSPLPRTAPIDKPTTGYDDVRMVALSRLALDDRSVEVDWTLYGPKLAQVALTFGADHLDAVPASDDQALGRRRMTVEDVERNIKAAGFEPREYRPASAGGQGGPVA